MNTNLKIYISQLFWTFRVVTAFAEEEQESWRARGMKKRGGLVVITESPRVVPPPVTSLFFFVGLVLFRVSSVLSFWVGSHSDLHRLLIQRSFTHHCPPLLSPPRLPVSLRRLHRGGPGRPARDGWRDPAPALLLRGKPCLVIYLWFIWLGQIQLMWIVHSPAESIIAFLALANFQRPSIEGPLK